MYKSVRKSIYESFIPFGVNIHTLYCKLFNNSVKSSNGQLNSKYLIAIKLLILTNTHTCLFHNLTVRLTRSVDLGYILFENNSLFVDLRTRKCRYVAADCTAYEHKV